MLSKNYRWYRKRAILVADGIRRGRRADAQYIVAGMPTMPSRLSSFELAFKSIIRQVDRLYLYLDGHDQVPDIVRRDNRVVVISWRDFPGLHGNGKFLGLALEEKSCLYLGVDDDIYYSHDYVHNLCAGLHSAARKGVVGLHASRLAQPFTRYNTGREIFVFSEKMTASMPVDVIGAGTSAFWTDVLRFDVRDWNFTNMVDLGLAIEAAKRGLPLICLSRRANLAMPLAGAQDDSVYARLRQDDSRQTELAHELLRLRGHSDPQTAPGSGDG